MAALTDIGWHAEALLTRLSASLRELALHINFLSGSLGPVSSMHYLWSAISLFCQGLARCIAISSGKTTWALLCCTAGELCFPSQPLHKAWRSKQLWAPHWDWLANYQLQFHVLFGSILFLKKNFDAVFNRKIPVRAHWLFKSPLPQEKRCIFSGGSSVLSCCIRCTVGAIAARVDYIFHCQGFKTVRYLCLLQFICATARGWGKDPKSKPFTTGGHESQANRHKAPAVVTGGRWQGRMPPGDLSLSTAMVVFKWHAKFRQLHQVLEISWWIMQGQELQLKSSTFPPHQLHQNLISFVSFKIVIRPCLWQDRLLNPKYIDVLAFFPACTVERESIPCSTLVDVAKKDCR